MVWQEETCIKRLWKNATWVKIPAWCEIWAQSVEQNKVNLQCAITNCGTRNPKKEVHIYSTDSLRCVHQIVKSQCLDMTQPNPSHPALQTRVEAAAFGGRKHGSLIRSSTLCTSRGEKKTSEGKANDSNRCNFLSKKVRPGSFLHMGVSKNRVPPNHPF